MAHSETPRRVKSKLYCRHGPFEKMSPSRFPFAVIVRLSGPEQKFQLEGIMLENSISLKVTRPIKLLLQHRKYNSYFGSKNCPLSKDTFVRHNKVRQQFLLYCNMLILLEGPSICYLNLPPLLYN